MITKNRTNIQNISTITDISTRSVVKQQLVDSYANTIYRINAQPEPIELRIGRCDEALAMFLQRINACGAAIISAYNPLSIRQSDSRNVQLHELLRLRLGGYSVIAATNIDPCNCWPSEESFFVTRIDQGDACSIGRQFNQNAIVWIDADARPILRLLR